MLSGTASMDFGGTRNVGGTAAQALTLKRLLPDSDAAADPHNWWVWHDALAPAALLGLLLGTRVWNARASGKPAAAH